MKLDEAKQLAEKYQYLIGKTLDQKNDVIEFIVPAPTDPNELTLFIDNVNHMDMEDAISELNPSLDFDVLIIYENVDPLIFMCHWLREAVNLTD